MEKKKKSKSRKKTGITILIVVLILIALLVILCGFITDFLWFRELGYVSVFLKKLLTQLEIGIPVFLIVGVLAYVYLRALRRGYYRKIESDEATDERSLTILSVVLAGLFAVIATAYCAKDLWFQWLNLTNSTGFDLTDPLFNNDISFYIFKLPFLQAANKVLLILAAAFILLTIIYYVVLLSVRTPDMFRDKNNSYDGPRMDDGFGGGAFRNVSGKLNKENLKQLMGLASTQLIIAGVIFFLMLGIHFFLQQYDLLYNHTGAVYGAGFTDVHVTLWVYRILMVLSLVGAVTFAVGVIKRAFKPIALVPIIMIIVFAVGVGASFLVQNYVVSPAELNKESKYLERNIEYTQHAYDLNNVNVKSFPASPDLSGEDIDNNPETITNIRINDYTPTEKLYNQTQAIRQYYDFYNVDVDRYNIDGEYTQTFLSAREINEASISQTWINTHMKYTHGYGVALSRVDTVTASGQADVLVGDIPPESDTESIKITNPAIYFGELTNNWILVNTSEQEFDYPDGDTNKYTKYTGDAGIKMNLFNRFMFALRERSLKLLVSSNINGDSKIVINRNVSARMQKIMPYLNYENDPYMVTVDGRLYWICDAYTSSQNFPYSEPYSQNSPINYIRNSVKVVVDAYNGDTNYYIVDKEDPIAATFQKIYPKLFKDIDEMPEGLQAHIRYPHTMLDIQASVYARYHMNDVSVFYQNEDLWSIANEIYGTKEKEMDPNYYILKLPGEKNAEFINSLVFTPKGKKNMTSLILARNDGDEYGNLVLYQFPKSKVVYGPMQVEALIDQNTTISKDFSLWSSNGTSYSRGNLFVIPIEESIMYVEPVYLEAKNSSIPEVKKVIVVFNDKIAYEDTLAQALQSMFNAHNYTDEGGGESAGGGEPEQALSQADIIQRAQTAYDNAQQALKDGKWSNYGKYMDQLENYLSQLQ